MLTKIIDYFMFPLVFLILTLGCVGICSHVINNLPYKNTTLKGVEHSTQRPSYANVDYVRKEINNLFSNTGYLLFHKQIEGSVAGYSYIGLKIVVMDTNLSLESYALTLAHELVHLTHITANERYVTFTTFKILYESGNEYFKNISLAYADRDVKGLMPYEYSCGGYIEEYLLCH